MDMNEYSRLALRTKNELGPTGNLIHATLGITSEAGEIADLVKKHYAYDKPLDIPALLGEIGDQVWFLNLLVSELGLTWDQVLEANIAKLEKRYPNLRFDAVHATQRDTAAEDRAVEAFISEK